MFIQTLKMSPAKTSKMVPKIQAFSYLKNTSRHTHMHSHDAQNVCLWNAPQLQEAVVQRTVSEKYDEFLVFLCGQQSTIIHSPLKLALVISLLQVLLPSWGSLGPCLLMFDFR